MAQEQTQTPPRPDIYTELLKVPPGPRPPDHYRLLGLRRFEADVSVIHAAVLRCSAIVRKHALTPEPTRRERVQDLLNEIGRAGVVLEDTNLRTAYNQNFPDWATTLPVTDAPTPARELNTIPTVVPAPVPTPIPPELTPPTAARDPTPPATVPTQLPRPWKRIVGLGLAGISVVVLAIVLWTIVSSRPEALQSASATNSILPVLTETGISISPVSVSTASVSHLVDSEAKPIANDIPNTAAPAVAAPATTSTAIAASVATTSTVSLSHVVDSDTNRNPNVTAGSVALPVAATVVAPPAVTVAPTNRTVNPGNDVIYLKGNRPFHVVDKTGTPIAAAEIPADLRHRLEDLDLLGGSEAGLILARAILPKEEKDADFQASVVGRNWHAAAVIPNLRSRDRSVISRWTSKSTGPCQLEVSKLKYKGITIPIPEIDPAGKIIWLTELRLEPYAPTEEVWHAVRGHVVTETGAPVNKGEASIRVNATPAKIRSPITDGAFAFTGVTPGKYLVEFWIEGYSVATWWVSVADADETTNLTAFPLRKYHIRVADPDDSRELWLTAGIPYRDSQVTFKDRLDIRFVQTGDAFHLDCSQKVRMRIANRIFPSGSYRWTGILKQGDVVELLDKETDKVLHKIECLEVSSTTTDSGSSALTTGDATQRTTPTNGVAAKTLPATATRKSPPAFYANTRKGVVRISLTGDTKEILKGVSGSGLQVLNNNLYVAGSVKILVYDLDGNPLRSVPLPPDVRFLAFTPVPGGGFALMNNHDDKVYFTDSNGKLLATGNMLDTPDGHLQNVSGVVVDNRLIVSEDGQKHVLAFDLRTHEKSIIKDLKGLPASWLGAITHADNVFYLSTGTEIWKFTETTDAIRIAGLPKGNATGIVIVDGFAFVCLNFTGEIYKVNLTDGTVSLFATGLDYPTALVFSN